MKALKALPKLTGSEKQIRWAEKIRARWIKRLETEIDILEHKQPIWDTKSKLETNRIMLEQYKTRTDAIWFIEWRTGVYISPKARLQF
jgi:hypothetical protein